MSKKILTSLAALAIAGFFSASAYGQCQPNQPNFNRGPVNNQYIMQNIVSAVDSLIAAQKAQNSGHSSRYAVQSNMRRAYYKIYYVKMSLQNNPSCNEGIEAFDVAIQKLNDRFLSLSERISEALKCLSIGAPKVVANILPTRQATLKLVRLALKFNELCLFEEVLNVLQVAEDCARALGRGAEPIGVAIEKATDRFLGPQERQAFVLDCLQVALQQITGRQRGHRGF